MHINQFKRYFRHVLQKPTKNLKQNELPFGYDQDSKYVKKPTVFDLGKLIKENLPRHLWDLHLNDN